MELDHDDETENDAKILVAQLHNNHRFYNIPLQQTCNAHTTTASLQLNSFAYRSLLHHHSLTNFNCGLVLHDSKFLIPLHHPVFSFL